MNQQEPKEQETAIEDLTPAQDEAVDVKGAARVDYFLKLKGIYGDATDAV